MSPALLKSAVIAALSGFLFGFDTVVISGAEKEIQTLWDLSNAQHGLAVGIALWGMVLGSLIGGWPSNKFGRRSTLLGVGILYFVSAIWSALANDVNSFMIARFLGGLGVGISTVAAPLYISEIAPPHIRGRLTGMFQFNIVFGILVAFLSNWLLGKYMDDVAWRWMLGVEAAPAIIYTLCCFTIPRSPRWLIVHENKRAEALQVLKKVNPAASHAEIEGLADDIAKSANSGQAKESLWNGRYRIPVLLAFLIAFFNQLSGINVILYYAPRIFALTGMGSETALQQSIGIGVTNLLFTFVGLYLIDKLGRRTLLYIGSFGYILSLGLIAFMFFTYSAPFKVASSAISASDAAARVESGKGTEKEKESLKEAFAAARETLVEATAAESYEGKALSLDDLADTSKVTAAASAALEESGEQSGSGGTIILLCIFAFIAAHAIGQGAVIWVFISEIFPNAVRASGQALGSFTHWIFAALLATFFPIVIGMFPPGIIFAFFAFMMVLQLLWVKAMVPETKGVPLEEMNAKLGIS
ncbi:MAG: sugar porter family MFS transporter [Verrucomicrobiota bacterium]